MWLPPFTLQGGFKAFWRAHGELVEGGYRPMDHPEYGAELKVGSQEGQGWGWGGTGRQAPAASGLGRRRAPAPQPSPGTAPRCLPQACHNAVKKAWAKTTRSFGRAKQQRRPSYRLRQSVGAASGGRGAEADAAGGDAAEEPAAAEAAALPPAVVAAQHAMR